MASEPKKLTIFDVQAKVAAGEKVFQVTATDYPTALLGRLHICPSSRDSATASPIAS